MTRNTLRNGQALVVMFFLMILSLITGIAISSKFMASLSMFARTDNASRALAVAEGGIEHLLSIPYSTLLDFVSNGTCGSSCILNVMGVDGVPASAQMTLSFLGGGSLFESDIFMDSVLEISLVGYQSGQPVSVCWNDPEMSITGLYYFQSGSSFEVNSFAYNSSQPPITSNNFLTATSSSGYVSCFSVIAEGTPQLLRLKSAFTDGVVYVIPSISQSLPVQGILITATGVVVDEVRRVSAIRSSPVLPAMFDYAIYQKSQTEPLSN